MAKECELGKKRIRLVGVSCATGKITRQVIVGACKTRKLFICLTGGNKCHKGVRCTARISQEKQVSCEGDTENQIYVTLLSGKKAPVVYMPLRGCKPQFMVGDMGVVDGLVE